MSNLSLAGWLERLEQLHPSAIDLGLSRCGEVGRRLDLVDTGIVTATVAGTNGKGTTVAVMESVLCANGLHCGALTSPHLIRFNERIRVDGQEVSDETIVAAFEAIERAREEVSLTYFEFGALAALWIFKMFNVQYQLLEVGLGGRLDAVNIIDADVTVITAIGLDHQEWLGETLDAIAIEKCGIARPSVSCVVADANAPDSVFRELTRRGAEPFVVGKNYHYDEKKQQSRLEGTFTLFIEQRPQAYKSKVLKHDILVLGIKCFFATNHTNSSQIISNHILLTINHHA